MRRTQFLAGSAALAGAATTRAIAQVPLPQTFVQQLNIAVTVPLSGPLAPYGKQILAGAQAAVDYSNQYQAPSLPVFAIRPYDDQGTVAMAQTNAAFATEDVSVLAAIGPLTTDSALAVQQAYANAGMALIVPANTADAITARGYRGTYRLMTKDSTEGQLFARIVLAKFNPKLPVAVSQDGSYGPDVAQGFTAQAKSDKRNGSTFTFSHDKPDYDAAAKAIVATGADYLFLAGKPSAMGPLIPALVSAGYTGAYGASDGFFDPATIKNYQVPLHGAWVASGFPPLQRAASIAFQLNDLERRIGDVSAFSAYGYSAAQVLMSAIQRASAANKLQVLQSLLTGSSYSTLTGSYTFGFQGDPFDPNLYFFSVQKDAFQYEKPAHPNGFVL